MTIFKKHNPTTKYRMARRRVRNMDGLVHRLFRLGAPSAPWMTTCMGLIQNRSAASSVFFYTIRKKAWGIPILRHSPSSNSIQKCGWGSDICTVSALMSLNTNHLTASFAEAFVWIVVMTAFSYNLQWMEKEIPRVPGCSF